MQNIDFLEIDKFKKEFLKWFNICFKNPTLLGKGKNEFYSINGLILTIYYHKDNNSLDNYIQLFIANFENVKNGNISVNFTTEDNKLTIVQKLDVFKNKLVENKLINKTYSW